MNYNPKIHHRRSIRLKGYDYSQAGLYFVTLCCQHREHFFSKIIDGELLLNDAGQMIERWYYELENKYPDIKCLEMVVMPNHFHCIIENTGAADISASAQQACPDTTALSPIAAVRADPSVCPLNDEQTSNNSSETILERSPDEEKSFIEGEPFNGGEHVGSPQRSPQRSPLSNQKTSLSNVIQWFKTMTTNEYIRKVKSNGWKRFEGKLWQRNYWEHIIRDERSYHNISAYIITNPMNWKKDTLQ